MNDRQPGLSKRIDQESRRISSQHQQLDDFYGLVAEAFEQGDLARVVRRFTRFRDALEAHLSLEERMYFPALRGLHPELEEVLTELVGEHVALRGELEAISAVLRTADLATARARLDDLVSRLTDHESREEVLVTSVSGGTPAPT